MAKKTGRPRGLTANRSAVEDGLRRACMAKAELATEAQISPSHLSDMLYRRKGTTEAVVRRMAMALGVSPETIAPELTGDFVALRPGAEIETGVA